MDMAMQIGQRVQWTNRETTIVVLLWELPWFLGAAETNFCGFEYHRSRVHFIMCGST
jgi:hypothetical protein